MTKRATKAGGTDNAQRPKRPDFQAEACRLKERLSKLQAELGLAGHDLVALGLAVHQMPHLLSGALPDPNGDIRREAERLFESALQAASKTAPVYAIRYVAAAAFTLQHYTNSFHEQSQDWQLKTLVDAAMLLGYASASLLPHAIGAMEEQLRWVRESLEAEAETERSLAAMAAEDFARATGAEGARIKNSRKSALKAWALDQAASMKDDDAGIARKLELCLPPEHVGVSEDPRRLIYDALRAKRRRTLKPG